MSALTALIRRYPLPAYFILAYVLAWIFEPLIAISPVYGLPGLFAPAFAAVIVSNATGGRAQVRQWLGRLAIWRINVIWYSTALGLPVVLSYFVAVLARFFSDSPALQPAAITPLAIVVFVLVVGEELGWRGYAQPELEKRYSPLMAALILGALWGIWHLPNFFIPSLPHYEIPLPAFVIYTTLLSVIAARLLKHTRGSVLITTLLHGATNTFGFLTPNIDVATRWWMLAGTYAAAAILIVIFYGVRLYHSKAISTIDTSLSGSALEG